jgi:exodeoxyribonuclease V alpha subunit
MTNESVPIAPPERPLRELRGVVERLTYQNPETGYTVARLAPEQASPDATRGDDRLVTLVGALADLTPGEAIVAEGWWQRHAKHGWQFQAVRYRTMLPASLQGMRKYLGSGLVKGIGPVIAERIVDAFGEATFTVIDADAGLLKEVPGIGPVRAARIAATWAEQRRIREVMADLQGFGLSTSLAVRIYKRFGDDSARVITEEPYRLAREVWGIGFKTADKVAQAVGIAPVAPQRLQAGVLHALSAAADDGHTLLPEPDLLGRAAELLDVPQAGIAEAIAALLADGDLVAATATERPSGDEESSGPDRLERRLALTPFARAESGLASRLQALAGAGSGARVAAGFATVSWEKVFAWLRERHDLSLAPEQEAGVRMAFSAPVGILTGGPGTGKTHTLRALLTVAQAKRYRCLLAAPTGRAAKRMADATGRPAATLHRLLDLRPGGQVGHGPDNPLDADLVVVDEASMLDALLANQLVKALAPGTHLLLVGDPDQLPSVGAGDVLADLLRSERLPVTRLTRIFRQGAGSGIAMNARRINAGEYPRFGGDVRDCFLLPADDPVAAAATVVELVARRIPARGRYRPADIQVLSPMHRGEVGVGRLNALLQERLNPGTEGVAELRVGGRAYRVGDRVLQQKNDYDLGVFNGDLGTVTAVDPVEQELTLRLDDGREVRYPAASVYALSHAYAISVHKAQGAEFPVVVLPLLMNHAPMLGRTLLYTALTRARELVILVGQPKALGLAVRDWRRTARQTALGGLLGGALRFHWPSGTAAGPSDEEAAPALWEGLLESAPPA